MPSLSCHILVLASADDLRDDLSRRVAPLTTGAVTAVADIDAAIRDLAGSRLVVLADGALPGIDDLPSRLAHTGGQASIVIVGDGAAPCDARIALPADPTDLELGVALGRAAERVAPARTWSDAEHELDQLASLLPDTAALLFDPEFVCRMARGPLALRAREEGVPLEGVSIPDLIGEDWPLVRHQWEAALRGERRRFDYTYTPQDMIYTAELLPKMAGGEVVSIVCVTSDVTAQRRAEAAEAAARDELARSEAWYRAIVDHLHEGVVLVRADGSWIANRSAERIFGLDAEQISGRAPLPDGWSVTQADGAPIHLRDLPGHVTRRTGETITDRTMGVRLPDGSMRWLRVSSTPIPAQDDPSRREAVASFIDITAQRQAELALAREHAALVEAQSLARVGSWRMSPTATSWSWSDELCRIFGRTPGDWPATFDEFLAHVHEDDRAMLARRWKDPGSGPVELYFRLRHRSGATAYVHLRAHVERDADGEIVGYAGVVQDVSERQEAEFALRAAQRRFEAAFDEAPIGMVLMDAEGRNVRVNRAIGELTGHSHAALLRMRHGVTGDHPIEPEELEAFEDLLSGVMQRWTGERRLVGADGRAMWVQLSAARLQVAPDEPPMILCHYLDISHRHRLERRLRHLAEHDPLTGVPNRRAWEAQVPQAIADAQRTGAPLGLALLDLNGFKSINDTHGHDAGDRVLREVAAAWRSQLRDSDLLARLGGDEFAVLLPDCGEEALTDLAHRLRKAPNYAPGCAVGAVVWHPGERVEDVVRRADAALYRDKFTPQG